MSATKCYLTTYDNPYNPKEDFDSWYQFDVDKHYNSCALLARFAHTSNQLSDAENDSEIERAIDSIIACDATNSYKKICL